ncbi:MAG: ABC transporter ATP-binding protein [Bacilli bacterium]
MSNTLLKIENLTTSFNIGGEYYPAVDKLTLDVNKNEVLAIVGESGCGKSALALTIAQLHNKANTKSEGTLLFKDIDLLKVSEKELNKIRGKEIGFIFQEPLSALNPLMTIGQQIEESLVFHTTLSKAERKQKALQILHEVGIPKPELTYKQYPHELSGGMRQRVMISIAIACEPSLVIADEPTTALDVTIQAQILDLLLSLQKKTEMSVILITHDLSVVAEVADRVVVMYAGEVVEIADVQEIFDNPLHPYTRSLMRSIPSMEEAAEKLHVIEGIVPSIQKLERTGCRFAPRIPWIKEEQHEEHTTLALVSENHWVRCSCYKHFHFQEGGEKL